MVTMRRYSTPTRGNPSGRADGNAAAAIKWAAWFALAGTGLLVVAALWASSCADPDTVACGRPERILLGLAAPLVLAIGAIGAFVRTYRVWKVDGNWWSWQGAGWFLLTLMLLILMMGFPAISGLIG